MVLFYGLKVESRPDQSTAINDNTRHHMNMRQTPHSIWRMLLLVYGVMLLLQGCAGNRALHPGDHRLVAGQQALSRAIEAILQDSLLTATTTGIHVVRLRDGATLYAHNSQKLFHPASNMKLLTAAAALLHLGPSFQFLTTIGVDSAIAVADTLYGDLYLVGRGDPSIETGDLAQLAEMLQSREIRAIRGNIVCDDSFLDDMRYGEGWMWDDQPGADAAPISALSINGNCIRIFASPGAIGLPARLRLLPPTRYVQLVNESVTFDSTAFDSLLADTAQVFPAFRIIRRWREHSNAFDVTGIIAAGSPEREYRQNIVDPARYFGTLFKEVCERSGITVSGDVVIGQAPHKLRVLAEHRSRPLATLLAEMNKPSDNLYAELLFKVTGAAVYGTPGTSDKAKRVIENMLREWGMDTGALRIADGSGVSRYTLLSPEIVTRVLVEMYRDFRYRSEFVASLPIAGVDGTLAGRMHGLAAEGVLHAKTGSLSGVSTLSGYTTGRDGTELAFSIMMAHFIGSTASFRKIQDRLCDVLARYVQSRRPLTSTATEP